MDKNEYIENLDELERKWKDLFRRHCYCSLCVRVEIDDFVEFLKSNKVSCDYPHNPIFWSKWFLNEHWPEAKEAILSSKKRVINKKIKVGRSNNKVFILQLDLKQ